MKTFILWLILLLICWPIALAAVFIYPVVWLLLLPFRIVGFAVEGVLDLIAGLFKLPGKIFARI